MPTFGDSKNTAPQFRPDYWPVRRLIYLDASTPELIVLQGQNSGRRDGRIRQELTLLVARKLGQGRG